MLPLLPALILLLLNGPANIERLAEGGALPAALAAIQQRIDTPQTRGSLQARADHLAMASLLSLSGDPQISRALARLLAFNVVSDEPKPVPAGVTAEPEDTEPPPIERSLGKPQDGFLRCQRSRDGPHCRRSS